MALREVLALTQMPVEPELQLAQNIILVLGSLVQKVVGICEEEGLSLKQLSAFSLKNNEWVIGMLQVYENCYRNEQFRKYEEGLVDQFEDELHLSDTVKPLL